MDKRKIGLILVLFSLLLVGNQVFGAGFQQLIHDTKSTTQATSFGQDLGFGNGDNINRLKLYLEPFDDGTGNYFKVQLWSDSSVDIWSNNVAIGEIGVKELYTFEFPALVELLVGEEFGFAVDTTGNRNFHIYGSASDSWGGGDGWNGGLAPVVDLYFDLGYTSTISYNRTPSGYTIENPVSFDLSFDDFSEICDPEEFDWWSIYIYSEFPENPQEIFSEDRILPTTKSHTFVETLPLGKYTEIKPACCDIEECYDTDPELEQNDWTLGGIFEVVEIPVLSYLTIPANLPADMLAYSGNLFTDLGLLITMTAGLPIGFKVIKRIIALVKIR